jgi:hypothetical protein
MIAIRTLPSPPIETGRINTVPAVAAQSVGRAVERAPGAPDVVKATLPASLNLQPFLNA